MREREFAFIIAVNNEIYFEECVYYINRLRVPEEFSVDILAIREADSMCAAYNLGMNNSDAKYKIYLHQDVFIRNEDFLYELLRIFRSGSDIGIIGMIGGNEMPKNGVTYQAWDVGLVDCRDADMAYELCGKPDVREDTTVEAVDGLLIATQYDVRWREDLFTKFDFYDIAASFEMRKKGYRVVVPYQSEPWVIHDSSFAKLANYDAGRKVCLREYGEYLYADNGFECSYNKEWDELCGQLAKQIRDSMEMGEWQSVSRMIAGYRQSGGKDSTMEMLGIMSDIYNADQKMEKNSNFFCGCAAYPEMYERYIRTRFWLRRMELGMPETEYEDLEHAIAEGELAPEVLLLFILHGALDKKVVCMRLEQIYKKASRTAEEAWMHALYGKVCKLPIPQTYTKKVQKLLEGRQ